jgi:hypothetical protein
MKIAIKFGDNDFTSCFFGVLKTLLNAYRHTGTFPNDKETLCNIINELSKPCYILFQNDILSEDTIEYIQIKTTNLLINEEVDDYSKLTEQHNSDAYVLDTYLDFYGSDAVYSL